MSLPTDDHSDLIPLAGYAAPEEPTVDMLQRFWQRARRFLPIETGDRAAGKETLQRASQERVADLTDHPDCSRLSDDLDRAIAAWLAERPEQGRPFVIVTSPCDSSEYLETWAASRGHAVMAPPARSTLSLVDDASILELAAPGRDGSVDGLLVIPRLEDWFLRHRGGLGAVRALLANLSAGEARPCLVGCNSWAWRYLSRVAGADLLLPAPATFRPFDADRLADWFAEVATTEAPPDTVFRESDSGLDVFARDDGNELQADFLAYLAARSRGVPWIAWALWRRSLRTRQDPEDEAASRGDDGGSDAPQVADDDKATIWLVKPEECMLPEGHERRSRLVLHALLLHGSLSPEELPYVLPISDDTVLVPALISAGLIETSAGRLRCTASAYPTVFESLETAGFSTPSL